MDTMLWGIPLWIWLVFFFSRIFWIAAGAIIWVYIYPRFLWNRKIEEKYFGSVGVVISGELSGKKNI
ncbi:MAG: hypothetical protein PHQ86_04690, partial [Dehalococcoidales bacterium]|nr:hypothetical protein [Dehalococcoidales bacterium]